MPRKRFGKIILFGGRICCGHWQRISTILLSDEGGYVLQHALANERAGKYFLRRGEKEVGSGYLKESLSVYDKWGGKAEVEHLKKRAILSDKR